MLKNKKRKFSSHLDPSVTTAATAAAPHALIVQAPTAAVIDDAVSATQAMIALSTPIEHPSPPSSPSSSSSSSTPSRPPRPSLASMNPRDRIICSLSHTIKHFEVGTRPNDERRRRRGNCKECVVTIGSSKAQETSYYCEECSESAAHTVFLHPEHHLAYHVRNLSEEDKQLYSLITGNPV